MRTTTWSKSLTINTVSQCQRLYSTQSTADTKDKPQIQGPQPPPAPHRARDPPDDGATKAEQPSQPADTTPGGDVNSDSEKKTTSEKTILSKKGQCVQEGGSEQPKPKPKPEPKPNPRDPPPAKR